MQFAPITSTSFDERFRAAFLTNELGISSDVQQSASYVSGWLKALRNDKSLIIKAASSAQAAVDFILAPTLAGAVA